MSSSLDSRRLVCLLAPLFLIPAFVLGCDAAIDLALSDTLRVEMRNMSSQPVHFLVPGESFSPSNRVQPGSSRTVQVGDSVKDGDLFTFRAGRNGQVLHQVTCEYFDHRSGEANTWTNRLFWDDNGWFDPVGGQQDPCWNWEID